jgi:DNA-binding NarL/FixJ family response regulator
MQACEVQSRQIFLIDDHPMVREFLTNLIHEESDLIVCGGAESSEEAIEKIAKIRPDLAIVDISLNGGSGLQLVKMIKAIYPSILTIVLSMHEERVYAERAIRAGARGYVMKRESSKRIIAAIREVLDGKLAVSDSVCAYFAERFVDRSGAAATGTSVESLSDRELEVFRLLGQGMDTRRVAEALNISIKTVQSYCARIKEKLNLVNASELLREAVRCSEIDPS